MTTTNRIIVSASPVVAVIVPPMAQATIPVVLPEPLAQALYRKWLHLDAIDCAAGFKRFSFDEFLIEHLKNVAYGHGEEPGAALDWVER